MDRLGGHSCLVFGSLFGCEPIFAPDSGGPRGPIVLILGYTSAGISGVAARYGVASDSRQPAWMVSRNPHVERWSL